jgi:hypothetical protein
MKFVYFWLVGAILLSACGVQPVVQPTSTTQATDMPTQPVLATDTAEPTATTAPTATTEPTTTPTTEPEAEWIAFIGNDGNIRMVDRLGSDTREMTADAAMPSPTNPGDAIQYSDLQASSDGELLAFRRDVGTPVQDGYTYVFEVWAYVLDTGESKLLLPNMAVAGMDWQPGTHLLAFAVPPEEGYFTTPQLDPSKARGIWAVDADSGENMELVAPQNDYSLARPQWSPDGRYLSFEEIWGMEGSGYFAFYNFDTQEYKSFDEALGLTDWSPDSQTVAYDMLTYIATGNEQIFLRPILGGEDVQVAPDYAEGYTYSPHFAPSGTQIAYFYHGGDIDSLIATVQVQSFDGGEVENLGDFENPLYMSWLLDGSGLILSIGPYGSRQVIKISLPDASVRVLADGDMPVIIP